MLRDVLRHKTCHSCLFGHLLVQGAEGIIQYYQGHMPLSVAKMDEKWQKSEKHVYKVQVDIHSIYIYESTSMYVYIYDVYLSIHLCIYLFIYVFIYSFNIHVNSHIGKWWILSKPFLSPTDPSLLFALPKNVYLLRIQNKGCLEECVGDMLGHVMYPSHIISSSTYPSQVHLNDKSCTLNLRYSGTPNIPSLHFSFEGHPCDAFDEYFKEHYGNHTGITTPPVFQELPLPRPKCSSHDHPCLASCSKAARYAARAKPRDAGWNIYW